MPHDGHIDDGHSHHGLHPHDHDHHHGGDRENRAAADHLHSHMGNDKERERREEIKVLAASFVEGFQAASDKTSYLRLSGIPFRRPGPDGLDRVLVDVKMETAWQVASASPAFGTRDLIHMPYSGEMIDARETMTFVYVSLTGREDVPLQDFMAKRL